MPRPDGAHRGRRHHGAPLPRFRRLPRHRARGSFPAGRTQWGLHDTAGNVFEWTADPYRGAFNSYEPEHADPALRFPQAEQAHTHGIGFRCAADVRG